MDSFIYNTRFHGAFPDANSQRIRAVAASVVALVAVSLSGCATYSSDPLPAQPEWSAASLGTRQPLAVDQVVALALQRSPEVRQAARDLKLAAAKKYADGLLPDPQVSLSKDFPGAQGFVPAFMAGISYEVSALITHAAKNRASLAEYQQHQLALLWVRWQVANRAYQVFVTSTGLAHVQHQTEALLAWQKEYRDRMQAALARGDVTLDALAQAESGYLDSLQQLNILRQDRLKAQQELDMLLDLPPGQTLVLEEPPEAQPVPPDVVQQALMDLPDRRPDLRALAAGYAAQDERYRVAILGQFPKLDVGFTRGRDTSRIYTSGFTISVALPVFNRNRGNIAIEKATRENLRDEYAQRLKDAGTAVQATTAELEMLNTQIQTAKKTEQVLERSLRTANMAYDRRDIDLATMSDINAKLLTQRIATARLESSRLQLQATLCTLIGVSAIDHQPLQRDRT